VTGIVVAVAVLVVATVFGVWHNRRDGRLRTVADGGVGQVAAGRGTLPSDNGPATLVADDRAAGNGEADDRAAGNGEADDRAAGNGEADDRAAGNGEADDRAAGNGEADDRAAGNRAAGNRAAGNRAAGNRVADHHSAGDQTLRDLGVDPATPVTLVQFSSAFCAPCRVTRRVLADVAGMVDGVTHLEVDAESHLDAVRALDIWRTPTTLIVANGRVVQRASGVPAKAQVLAAVAPMLESAAR
jgi:thiol-disulfide isomerase/thioredoxin